MSTYFYLHCRFSLSLLLSALLFSGCSSSTFNDSNTAVIGDNADVMVSDSVDPDNGSNNLEGESTQATNDTTPDIVSEPVNEPVNEPITESDEPTSTRVEFEVNVPVYVSSALQVRLVWGEFDTTAMWNIDELWTLTADLPVNTTNQLMVTFSDDNGGITLGNFETSFSTGANSTESFRIAATDFDTDQWDTDNDGVSNLSESIAGTNPQGDEALIAVEAVLELVPDKTFRFSWESTSGAEFYRVLENADGVSGFLAVSGDLAATVVQFDHRVGLHNRLSASYIVQACNQQSCVDSQELFVPNSIAPAVGYFKANDALENDSFGAYVALSADGNTMAVTALGNRGTLGSRGERVYVFSRVDGAWQQQAILVSSHRTPGFSHFGDALSLNANGDVLVIGSSRDRLFDDVDDPDSDSQERAGAVYVFQRESGNWREQARLVSNSLSQSDELGYSVSVSNDGRTIAAGAPGDSSDATCCGAVIIFELVEGTWQQQNQVFAENTNTSSDFGSSVSFSDDGTTLAVGDFTQRGLGDTPKLSGAAYIFSRNGADWEQQAVLRADDPIEEAYFGRSISLDADGDVLAVGAPHWNFGQGSNGPPVGAAYVFRNTAGSWQQEARLNTTFFGDITGDAVALSGDGSTLFVSSDGASFVSIYKSDGVNWLQQLRFNGAITQAQNEAPTALDSSERPLVSSPIQFANSISLSSDGETLAIGASADDSAAREINGDRNDTSRNNSGAVFLF